MREKHHVFPYCFSLLRTQCALSLIHNGVQFYTMMLIVLHTMCSVYDIECNNIITAIIDLAHSLFVTLTTQ